MVAATALPGSVRLTANRLTKVTACPIQPTEVITCSHTTSCRHRCPRRFTMPETLTRKPIRGPSVTILIPPPQGSAGAIVVEEVEDLAHDGLS